MSVGAQGELETLIETEFVGHLPLMETRRSRLLYRRMTRGAIMAVEIDPGPTRRTGANQLLS